MKSFFQRWNIIVALFCVTALSSFILLQDKRPVFYIVGDSTVRNGDGTGKGNLWGWGSFIADHVDTNKIAVRNYALGGRSSRTFITEGRWDKVLADLKKGDFVIMQFGHNDGGPLDDTARARGSIKGTGEESKEIYNPIMKKQEVVYTYGYYMRKYIRDVKAKAATAIVCSPIPRNDWKEGKVSRSSTSYAKWAKEVADQEGALFIDLNEIIATRYESLGTDAVKQFFPGDHTHTNMEGARFNAEIVIAALKEMNLPTLKSAMK